MRPTSHLEKHTRRPEFLQETLRVVAEMRVSLSLVTFFHHFSRTVRYKTADDGMCDLLRALVLNIYPMPIRITRVHQFFQAPVERIPRTMRFWQGWILGRFNGLIFIKSDFRIIFN